MSERLWVQVREALDSHAYMSGVERTAERVRATGEVFTPSELVIEMLQGVDLAELGPGRTVLDPACGDGQFLVAAKAVKVHHHGMSEADALADLFGIDLMPDNVVLCRRRLGGGTIVVGDALHPERRVAGQSDEDHRLMRELFAARPAELALF